jgi:hypothetical protein
MTKADGVAHGFLCHLLYAAEHFCHAGHEDENRFHPSAIFVRRLSAAGQILRSKLEDAASCTVLRLI